MKNLSVSIIAFCLLTIVSCDRIVRYNVDFDDKKLVVYAFVSPQNGITLQLTKALHPYEYVEFKTNNPYINNASIKVFENGNFKTSLINVNNEGNYELPPNSFTPISGNNYQLQIKVEGYEDISTEIVTIPPEVPIQFERKGLEFFDNGREIDTVYLVDIVFNDPPSQANFYALQKNGIRNGKQATSPYAINNLIPFGKTHEACNIFAVGYNLLFFHDICFNGNERRLELALDNYYYDEIIVNGSPSVEKLWIDSVEIIFSTTSTDFQNHYETVILQENGVNSLFSEPKLLYTNIIGGYGVFAPLNSATFTVEM